LLKLLAAIPSMTNFLEAAIAADADQSDLVISSKTRRHSFKIGNVIARRKPCSCQAFRISNGTPFQKIPE
jgi:hypothetical protein